MLKQFILLLFVCATCHVLGQSLIVNDPVNGGNGIMMNEYMPINYFVGNYSFEYDLDFDGTNDIMFYSESYAGGSQSTHNFELTAYGDFQIIIDTNYVDSVIIWNNQTQAVESTVDTFTTVRRFESGDTIDVNHPTGWVDMDLHRYSANQTPGGSTNVHVDIIENEGYIGLIKTSGSQINIYCLRIERFELAEYPNYENLGGFKMTALFTTEDLVQEFIVYPNPAEDQLMIKGQIKAYSAYSLQGSKVIEEKNVSGMLNTINLEALSSGPYLIEITNMDGEAQVFRIIKR